MWRQGLPFLSQTCIVKRLDRNQHYIYFDFRSGVAIIADVRVRYQEWHLSERVSKMGNLGA